MLGSRTIKILTALLVSMTVGAFALMVLETAPVSPKAHHLAAVAAPLANPGSAIYETSVPLQPIKWRNVIVHASGSESPDITERCHFLVAQDGKVSATALWKRQLSGHHVYVPGRDFNADSIAVCLIGLFSQSPPEKNQLTALVKLVRTLQPAFQIPADRVYLLSELDAYTNSPGSAFPVQAFNRSLYR